MSDIEFRFILLRTLLAVAFIVSGYYLSISRNKREYWRIALIPILSFAFISGLRFAREIDYNAYYFFFTDKTEYQRMDLLYRYIVETFHLFGLSYPFFIFCCSTFFIISFLYFLQPFQKLAFYMLPFFLLFLGIENLIRWYLAFSFILLAFPSIVERKLLRIVPLLLAASLTHSGMIILVVMIFAAYYFGRFKLLNPKVMAVFFFITLFLGSTAWLQEIVSVLNFMNLDIGGEREQKYITQAVEIAGGERGTGIYDRSLTNNIRLFIVYGLPLLFVDSSIVSKKYYWLFNLAMMSIVIMPIFKLVEIFNRYSASLNFISVILLGAVLYHYFFMAKEKKLTYYFFVTIYIITMYPIFTQNFASVPDNQMLFLWDANGRNYLNNYLNK